MFLQNDLREQRKGTAWGLIGVGVGPRKELNGAMWFESPVVRWGSSELFYQPAQVWGKEKSGEA